ncbi:acetylornithine transaminase [Salinibacterium sp. ZJ454]|uniref:acetylornithine transaminase n=1 Tax=Salinibacterium sp. ZJ454 TaxID=2708339 RepID=UPI002444EFF9|nr:acetylornithine transaminase [Salinibacterium sp. ZJ454]
MTESDTVIETYKDRFAEAMMKSAPTPLRLLERGLGCYVWDSDQNQYLDFLGGIAVNSLGHAHPALVDAVSNQVALAAHVSNYFATAPQIELAERLLRLSGAGDDGRVYFGNSGAEAIEAAVKLARRNNQHGRIIALHHGFHGRTMGSLALTAKAALREPFEPMLPGVEHIEATVLAIEAAFAEHQPVAAVVMELIQGEAGVVELDQEFIVRARELTAQHGALLIIDEIQTGAGRTGDWFAFQGAGIVPDAIAVAKGIAGGVPIGALITFGAASDLFTVGQHGSTFGGNPLATAAGNAVLGEIERAGLLENAAFRGGQLKSAILKLQHPLVHEVRGRGLLLGVGLTDDVAHAVAARALDLGLIVNAANDTTIRLAPPLIIGDAEVEIFIDIFARALEEAQ